jgi:hypothetical protein
MASVTVKPIETAIFPFNLSTNVRVNGYEVEDVGCFLIEEIPVYPVKFNGALLVFLIVKVAESQPLVQELSLHSFQASWNLFLSIYESESNF